MILQATGDKRGLTVAERLAAVNDGFRRNDDLGADFVWRMIGITATLALAIVFAVWAFRRLRRLRWVGHHLRTLAGAGLHDEELALFKSLARHAVADRVPLLTRQAATFDLAVAEMVRRHRPASERRELVARLLALRRRMPFEGRGTQAADFPVGLALLVCVRFGSGDPYRLPAKVAAEQPQALQLELEETAAAREVAPLLRVGAEVILVVQRDMVFQEARVRIRAALPGSALGLLVDRPVGLAPARVRIVWQETDEPVMVEMVERFTKRYVGDDVPTADVRVVATTSEGLLLQFATTRPRHGESIRVTEGARAGVYRSYAVLERKGSGGEVFVLRRPGERMDSVARASALRRPAAPGSPVRTVQQAKKGTRNEPVPRP